MKFKHLLFSLAFIAYSVSATAGGDLVYNQKSGSVTFIKDKRLPDVMYQHQLRHAAAWQNFMEAHGTWYVKFNEENGKPHTAFGKPIPTTGVSYEQRALNFIQNELSAYAIPASDLVIQTVNEGKHVNVIFKQKYDGLDVLFTRMYVKMTQQGDVILFGTDVYNTIDISTVPAFSAGAALNNASYDLADPVVSSNMLPQLAVLPIPGNKEMKFHLVYQFEVKTMSAGKIPGDYLCYVDANDGTLLYRQNRVMHIEGDECHGHDHGDEEKELALPAVTITLEGTVVSNPQLAGVVRGLPNARVMMNGMTYYTDANGMLTTTDNAPISADFALTGLYSNVITGTTGNNQSSFTQNIATANETVSWDTNANDTEISAYYGVNAIHDHMKVWTPAGFTNMDNPLETRVDITSDACNAFYNGSSINFYAAGTTGNITCDATSYFDDVVYHEYGHGINSNLYNYYGGFFSNGALGEGYADIWAMSLTNNPILGDGFSGPGTDVRRYDINPKVYPQDLIGEVHADGEIIAGAWWDLAQEIGMNNMMTLYSGTMPAVLTAATGNEGDLFTDVLVEALMIDDNDGDITNGTPNGLAITDNFDKHGITLLSNADLQHTALELEPALVDITINADLTLTFPWNTYLNSVACNYRINGDPTWTTIQMTGTGNTYTGQIPAQPYGTLVAYYLGAEDVFGNISSVIPVAAEFPSNPNVPYYIMVGFSPSMSEDLDFNSDLGNWETGLATDNATTGEWEINIPLGSFGDVNDPSTMVAPDHQHTPNGELCFVTGNANLLSDAIGTNDVDGGTTTLQSAVIDLSGYTNPAFTYYRWYINNPASGANPNADWWQVSLSDDGGSTWVLVENTLRSDRSWRRVGFRVQDYVNITNQFQMRFNVSDSIRAGQNLNGGSLIEGALDDIVLWDNADPNGIGAVAATATTMNVWPNPAQELVNANLNLAKAEKVTLVLTNNLGQEVWRLDAGQLSAGQHKYTIPLNELSNGIYMLNVQAGEKRLVRKVTRM